MNIKAILKTATIRQTAITMSATGINGILAVVFYLMLARIIGSNDYGIFTLASTTIVILGTVFEFGVDRSAVKFLAFHKNNPLARLQISRLILTIKLVVGSSVALITVLFSQSLAELLFHRPELAPVMPVIGFGLLSQMLFYFAFYYAQAHEKFTWWGAMLAGSNATRLILAFILLFFHRLNAYNATVIWALAPLFGFFLGLKLIDKKIFSVTGYFSRIPEIFTFNKWVTAFSVVAAISSRLDTYVTAQLVNLSSVGVYGLGSQAVAYLPQIILALGAVTSPKFASFNDHSHNRKYVVKTTFLSIGIACLAALAMVPGGWLLFRLSGTQYTGGMAPYLLLLLSMLLFLVTSPVRDSILYFYNKPQFFFWAGIGQGIVAISTGIWLIPKFGLLGSALSNLFGQTFLSISAIALYLRLTLKQNHGY